VSAITTVVADADSVSPGLGKSWSDMLKQAGHPISRLSKHCAVVAYSYWSAAAASA
jgi:hypothetical protein